MEKITTEAHIAGQEVKTSNPSPDVHVYSAQPDLEKRNNDPSSTCQTSSRYPIPSLLDSRVWGRA